METFHWRQPRGVVPRCSSSRMRILRSWGVGLVDRSGISYGRDVVLKKKRETYGEEFPIGIFKGRAGGGGGNKISHQKKKRVK